MYLHTDPNESETKIEANRARCCRSCFTTEYLYNIIIWLRNDAGDA